MNSMKQRIHAWHYNNTVLKYVLLHHTLINTSLRCVYEGLTDMKFYQNVNVNGLVQDCSNSSVLAMELLQSCTLTMTTICETIRHH